MHSLSRPRIRVRYSTTLSTPPPGVGADLATVELARGILSVQALKYEHCSGTLCVHELALILFFKLLL